MFRLRSILFFSHPFFFFHFFIIAFSFTRVFIPINPCGILTIMTHNAPSLKPTDFVTPFLSISLSIHPSLSSISVGLPNYIQCPQWVNVNKLLLVGLHWHVYVLGSIGERIFFFQRYPVCFVRHTWMFFEMGGKSPYRWYFVRYFFLDSK